MMEANKHKSLYIAAALFLLLIISTIVYIMVPLGIGEYVLSPQMKNEFVEIYNDKYNNNLIYSQYVDEYPLSVCVIYGATRQNDAGTVYAQICSGVYDEIDGEVYYSHSLVQGYFAVNVSYDGSHIKDITKVDRTNDELGGYGVASDIIPERFYRRVKYDYIHHFGISQLLDKKVERLLGKKVSENELTIDETDGSYDITDVEDHIVKEGKLPKRY